MPQAPNAGAGEGTGRLMASGVSVSFAGVQALQDVTVTLAMGEVLGLIGPNGAGKTTLVNVLTGFQKSDAGALVIDDKEVTGWAPHRIGRAGLARTFQAARLFGQMTVRENIELAALSANPVRSRARREADRIIDWMRLGDLRGRMADALPHGDQRRVGVARALASSPRYLLLDEPAAGLNEHESEELLAAIARIRADFGCGLLLIEHNIGLIMEVSDRIHVLSDGRSLAEGTPESVRADPEVRRAYLGTTDDGPSVPARGRGDDPASGTTVRPPLLAVEDLVVRHGSVEALRGVTIEAGVGELVAVVGPNGAGKTSLLQAITALVRPAGGRIVLDGVSNGRKTVEDIVAAGVALVPEGRQVFPALTVAENLAIGARDASDGAKTIWRVDGLLEEFPILRERADMPAGRLSGGEQQQLAIARALAGNPRLLLLDEPSLGLAPLVIERVYEMLRQIHDSGVTILLVEQDAARALDVADRTYVLRSGLVALSGPSDAVLADVAFDRAYFGFPDQPAAS